MAVLASGICALVPSSQSWDTAPNVQLQLFIQQSDKNKPDSLSSPLRSHTQGNTRGVEQVKCV